MRTNFVKIPSRSFDSNLSLETGLFPPKYLNCDRRRSPRWYYDRAVSYPPSINQLIEYDSIKRKRQQLSSRISCFSFYFVNANLGIVQKSIGTIYGDVQAESFPALVYRRGYGWNGIHRSWEQYERFGFRIPAISRSHRRGRRRVWRGRRGRGWTSVSLNYLYKSIYTYMTNFVSYKNTHVSHELVLRLK